MNFYKLYTAFTFLFLCFIVFIALSDESAVHNLLYLSNSSAAFISSFFIKPVYQLLKQNKTELFSVVRILFGAAGAALWAFFLVYVKRSDILDYNEAYSIGRFVYVFGTVALSSLISFALMKISFHPKKVQQ